MDCRDVGEMAVTRLLDDFALLKKIKKNCTF